MRYNSPLGTLHIQAESGYVTALRFCDCIDCDEPGCEAEAAAAAWLDAYFSGAPLPPIPPLNPAGGSEFQRRVWKYLLEIPIGSTASYGQIAAHLGSSARAVGQAAGANPVAIIIPCHRVVAAGGKLGGYAYGKAIKQALLNLEATHVPFGVRKETEEKK
ncbi:MAG: methylated-DNA--[protein]-cysteine S-methyltransferase [Muribaculaceae bacterium]|nr:methylated-DNA--[protein]-cysteine S-methyltransferase [Muribaculaceae bacterium]